MEGPNTAVVNLGGRTVIPGLIDSHMHATVAGLSWDRDLHWESVRSLADGLKQIEAAARNKPAGTWIVVGGGWAPGQFAEKRLPTRAELDDVAPKHPHFRGKTQRLYRSRKAGGSSGPERGLPNGTRRPDPLH